MALLLNPAPAPTTLTASSLGSTSAVAGRCAQPPPRSIEIWSRVRVAVGAQVRGLEVSRDVSRGA
jgi:hypothetical protein